jgi:putative transposase
MMPPIGSNDTLPDHLHCVWTLPERDGDFFTRWQSVDWVEAGRKPVPKPNTPR